MGEVVEFSGITTIPEDPASALEKAKSWGLERVLIIGITKDDGFVFGGSHSENGIAMLMLEQSKKEILLSTFATGAD